jgi:anti-sigma regulatory factor (Ser/Thr protein kinase)
VELQALPSRISQVRRIVSAQLRHWHLHPLIDAAALGVTELLANVHRHARPDRVCTVDLELRAGRLTVSVRDHDPRVPVLRPEEDLWATSGRGLDLVAAVSDSWGVRPEGASGKAVWFSLAAPSPAVGPPARISSHEEAAAPPLTAPVRAPDPDPEGPGPCGPALGTGRDRVREPARARSAAGR